MGAQKGKDLLVKMHDGSSYVTVAGLRSRSPPRSRPSFERISGSAARRKDA